RPSPTAPIGTSTCPRSGSRSVARGACYAMAPMSDELRERLQSALPDADIVLGSGMSECTPATVMQWPELNPDKSASWGYGTPATENRICEPGGPELLLADTDGELAY